MNQSIADKYPLGSWIWRQNLEFVLRELAQIAGTEYDALDHDAIEYGIQNTDSEIPFYFESVFEGSLRIKFAVANESGTNSIMVLVDCPDSVSAIVNFLLSLATEYNIQTRT